MQISKLIEMLRNNQMVEGDIEVHFEGKNGITKDIELQLFPGGIWILREKPKQKKD